MKKKGDRKPKQEDSEGPEESEGGLERYTVQGD